MQVRDTQMPQMPDLPKEKVLTPEWEAAFRTWQARLRDYLVEKEFYQQELERLVRASSSRIPVTGVAYTSDPESSAYTGIDNLQPGTVYAQVADLEALRDAYENLRVAFDTVLANLQ
jgi:hypothetical protein